LTLRGQTCTACPRPNDQNSDRGIETSGALVDVDGQLRPNDQNSDRGIETWALMGLLMSGARVRTTRIPTEELKRLR